MQKLVRAACRLARAASWSNERRWMDQPWRARLYNVDLRALPSCAPINRDHAREHDRKSDFCFEVGNETRNPRRRGRVPIKCCSVACDQVANKPDYKSGCVKRPADAFGHPTPPRFSAASQHCGERRVSGLGFHNRLAPVDGRHSFWFLFAAWLRARNPSNGVDTFIAPLFLDRTYT